MKMKTKDKALRICPACMKELIEEGLNDFMTFLVCTDCNAIMDYYTIERRKTTKKVTNERRR